MDTNNTKVEELRESIEYNLKIALTEKTVMTIDQIEQAVKISMDQFEEAVRTEEREKQEELKRIIVMNFYHNMPKPLPPTGERRANGGQMKLYNDQMKWWMKAKKIESNP